MVTAVWALEGDIAGTPVRWSTAPMEGFDSRLAEKPGAFRYGLGDTVGVMERLSVSLTVANDGALDALAMGAAEDDVDWQGPSLRDLRCRLYRYTGPATRQAMTPPLVVSDYEVDVGVVTITLMADEHAILGPSAALATVEDWRRGGMVVDYAHESAASYLGVLEAELAGVLASALQPGNHTQIPWLYPPATVPLEPVSEDGRWRIAGMITDDHAAAIAAEGEYWRWWLYYGETGGLVSAFDRGYPVILRSSEGLKGSLLVFFFANAPEETTIGHRFDAVELGPVEIITRILEDHAPSPDPYDSTSAAWADLATRRLAAVVGGVYEDAATVEEALAAIAPICGVEAYVHLDGRLHFAPFPTPDEEAAPVLELDAHDVYPASADRIPAAKAALSAAPPSFGAVAGTISVDWPDSRMDAYPVQTGTDHRRVSDAEGEVRLVGAWIHPPRASVALTAAAEWYGYPLRLVSIPTHVSVLGDVDPGDVIAFRAPALPGSQRRLGMVRHVEVLPGDETAVVTVGDLGWEGMINYGVLDSFENWVAFEALAGTTVQLSPPLSSISLSAPAFTPADVGRRIWIRRGHPSNQRSYRIVHIESATSVQVEPPPAVGESWVEAGGRGMLVMRTADHPDDPAVIGGKIGVSDTPLFSNDERAFRFAR